LRELADSPAVCTLGKDGQDSGEFDTRSEDGVEWSKPSETCNRMMRLHMSYLAKLGEDM
jgi:hypothetical protein